jgi:hypothetical protein
LLRRWYEIEATTIKSDAEPTVVKAIPLYGYDAKLKGAPAWYVYKTALKINNAIVAIKRPISVLNSIDTLPLTLLLLPSRS